MSEIKEDIHEVIYQQVMEKNADGVEFIRISTLIQYISKKNLSQETIILLGSKLAKVMGRNSETPHIMVTNKYSSTPETMINIHHYGLADLPKMIKFIDQIMLSEYLLVTVIPVPKYQPSMPGYNTVSSPDGDGFLFIPIEQPPTLDILKWKPPHTPF
jgi:hypothetical protein